MEVVLGLLLLFTSIASAKEIDFSIEKIEDSPGLYYEHKGEAQLYSSEWKVVTYVNLSDIDVKYESLLKYANYTISFCQKYNNNTWTNVTDCTQMLHYVPIKINDISNKRQLVYQLARNQESPLRMKRGALNFIGELSKVLFGTMDEADAKYYTEKINRLEMEQTGILKLTREQMTVVKATLRTVNSTVREVQENEDALLRNLKLVEDHLNQKDGELKGKIGLLSVTLHMEKHMMQLNRIIYEIEQDYELIVSAIVNAQQGILQPHVITPVQIMETMKRSRDEIPNDLSLPFPMSVAYSSALLNVIEFDVFINHNVLVYVIKVPLTDHIKFNVYQVFPFPIRTELNAFKFLFIQPEKPYIFMDIAKRFYSKLTESDLSKCKKINMYWRVCKQMYPILSTHLHEECEAKMLQPIRKIPSDCSVRVAILNQTLWTQLDNNEWLYVSARPESITILCEKQDPVDVVINGTGKLKLVKKCKGYGPKVLIQSQFVFNSNYSNKDVIPPLSLSYDCCLDWNVAETVNSMKIDTHLNHIVNNIEDLKYASHKVQEVENLLSEEEWKQKQSERVYNLSFMSIIGLVAIVLILCCYCCKCCKVYFPRFLRSCENGDSCTTIVFRPKIINKVHTSNEVMEDNRDQGEEGVCLNEIMPSPGPGHRPGSRSAVPKR